MDYRYDTLGYVANMTLLAVCEILAAPAILADPAGSDTPPAPRTVKQHAQGIDRLGGPLTHCR